MPYESLTQKHLNNLKDEIIKTMQKKGMFNTGATAASLEVSGNTLLGNEAIIYLDKGRGPGNFPPVANIRDWVREKLGIKTKQVDRIAYLVGRKIANEGTEIYKNTALGLKLDELVEDMLDDLEEAVADEAEIEILKLVS